MLRRLTSLVFLFGAVLALAACSGGSDDEAAEPTVESGAQAATTTPPATTEDAPAAVDDAPADEGGCVDVVTPEEIDAIFGTSVVEITGQSEQCNVFFASDSLVSLSVYDGSKGEEALEELLGLFESRGEADRGGVLLADGRGYVTSDNVVVLSDSGRVIVTGVPSDLELADRATAMRAYADLLLTR